MMQQHQHQHQHQQQHHHMLYGGGATGGGGNSGGGGGGLSRFRSAPATWFDSLLEDDEQILQPPPPSQRPPPPSQRPPQPPQPQQPPPPPQQQQQQQVPHGGLPQIPNLRNSSLYDPTTLFETNFTRHNSSPPQLLSTLSLPPIISSDDYFSNSGVPSNFDILSCLDIPTSTTTDRPGESDSSRQVSQSVKGEPSSLTDMEMEKLFQDSVPCRVRAKRGCATHPRSIAERVRRTRISDRIRKLQELVPNMDKQTNTADMLDEAVEYVKLLQKQIQELTEHQKKCKCLTRE